MIPLKIKNKKYRIKSIDELTAAEFIAVTKIEGLDLVKYISWQLELPINTAFHAVIDPRLEVAIGRIPDVAKLPKPKGFDYSKLIQTVGQRHQIEESGLTGYELLVFVLAVSQANSSNIDDVHRLRDSYLARPFSEILPAGFFFFKILQAGNSSGQIFLKRLLVWINTRFKRSKPVSRS